MDPKKVEFDLEADQEKKVANDVIVPPPVNGLDLARLDTGRGRGR